MPHLQPELDYQFGWRWLLPANGTVRLVGYDETAVEFWTHRNRKASKNDARCCIVNADLMSAPEKEMLHGTLEAGALESAAIIGKPWAVEHWRGQLRKRFRFVHSYALVPPNNPRVVVPLGTSDFTIKGLRLHRPGRTMARVALTLIALSVRLGANRLLARNVLVIASNQEALVSKFGFSGQERPGDYALYLGTKDKNRKTVALPLYKQKKSSVILKCAENETARTSLRHEREALEILASSSLSRRVPKIYAFHDDDNQTTLVQEYRQRQSATKRKLNDAAVDFLAKLSQFSREEIPLHSLGLTPFDESYPSTVWVHRGHGDFAPWNCSWADGGLFVFDWEESRERQIALADAFYYVVSPFLYGLTSRSSRKVGEQAVAFASLVARAASLELDVRFQFALWLTANRDRHAAFRRLLATLKTGSQRCNV